MICETISTKCQESNEDPYWNFIKFYHCLFSSRIRKIHSDLLYNPLLVSFANIYIYMYNVYGFIVVHLQMFPLWKINWANLK